MCQVQVNTNLPLLHSQPVLPHKFSIRRQALNALRAIESITINDSIVQDNHRYYILNIYYKSSNIQQFLPPSQAQSKDTPDLQIRHRYSDFHTLREQFYFYAHAGHERSAPCRLCSKLMEYKIVGRAQPNLLAKVINSETSVCQLLQQFINDVVRLTLCANPYNEEGCTGERHIPLLIKNFVLGETRIRHTSDHVSQVLRPLSMPRIRSCSNHQQRNSR